MKSRTLSCKAALRKDIARFWPVWAGSLLCLVVLQITLSSREPGYWYHYALIESMNFMGVFNCGFGLVSALALFGDLFTPRMCNGLHSLPLKREHWFKAHITAGLLFSLLPTALMAGFSEILVYLNGGMANGWQVPLYWWAASNLQYFFFFALAVFSVMCTGARLAAALVYGMVNFFSALLLVLVDMLYTPLLYGVVTQSKPFTLLCPVWELGGSPYLTTEPISFPALENKTYGEFTVNGGTWLYLGILVLIGFVLLLAARGMYKRRNLECAGDFMAVSWLEPVFQAVFTILCAAGFYSLFYGFFGTGVGVSGYALVGIGLVTGWFAGRMFLERTTRVFRLKNFAGLALMAVLTASSFYITWLDPLGIEEWVPAAEEVESVRFTLSHRDVIETEDPAEIGDILRLQALALEERTTMHPDYDDYYTPYDGYAAPDKAATVNLTYRLSNGWTAQREYYVQADGATRDIVVEYASRLETVIDHDAVHDLNDLRHEIRKVQHISVRGKNIPQQAMTEEFLLALADAIAADCEAGAMVQSNVYHPDYVISTGHPDGSLRSVYLEGYRSSAYSSFTFYLSVYSDCVNTLRVLESTGVMEQVRQEYLEDVSRDYMEDISISYTN